MPEFILDTSGVVYKRGHVFPAPINSAFCEWARLDAFTQGYIEALFFTSTSDLAPDEWDAADIKARDLGDYDRQPEGLRPGLGFSDLAPETVASIIADCDAFKLACCHVQPLMGDDGYPDEMQAGRDFWFTRNGHGVGFDDGDWPEPHADDLEKAATAFAMVDAYLGDDGKVYLS